MQTRAECSPPFEGRGPPNLREAALLLAFFVTNSHPYISAVGSAVTDTHIAQLSADLRAHQLSRTFSALRNLIPTQHIMSM